MSASSWMRASPRQMVALREAVRSGALGGGVRFLAVRSEMAFDGRGVLDALAGDSLALLVAIFGELSLEESRHDGRGGPEAEAAIRLRTAHATGEMVLTRLRPLGERIEIAGEHGWIRFDIRGGRVEASPPELLRPETGSVNGTASPPHWLGQLGERAQPLRHPWEIDGARHFSEIAGKRVLVTGSTGFIGARVVERLAENGAVVTAVLRGPAKAARIARLGVELAPMHAGTDLARMLRGHDAVVNLAHDFHAAPQRNEGIATALADACEAVGVPLLVQASSIAVYDGWPGVALDEDSPSDGPGHSYKQLKRAIERDLLARQETGRLRSVILQPTIVYGAFSRLWTDRFADHFRIGDVAVPAEGLCEGVHVDDLADAILAALVRPSAEGRYIVSGPSPIEWREMLSAFPQACRAWGELRIEEPLPPVADAPARGKPGMLARLKGRALATAVGLVRRTLGEQRLAELRDILLKLVARGQRPLFRPAAENPRLFANRAAVSTERMRRELVEPVVGIERGFELVRAYLAWRYCSFEEWPGNER